MSLMPTVQETLDLQSFMRASPDLDLPPEERSGRAGPMLDMNGDNLNPTAQVELYGGLAVGRVVGKGRGIGFLIICCAFVLDSVRFLIYQPVHNSFILRL